jgi:signal transduction histidine kinase
MKDDERYSMTKPTLRRNNNVKQVPKPKSDRERPSRELESDRESTRTTLKTTHRIAPVQEQALQEQALHELGLQETFDQEMELRRLDTSGALVANTSVVINTAHATIVAHSIAVNFTYQLLAAACSYGNLRDARSLTPNHQVMDDLLAQFENDSRLALGQGFAVDRLRKLLHQLQQGRLQIQVSTASIDEPMANVSQRLAHSIHAALSALSGAERWQQAVEDCARKAIYEFAYGLSHEINNPLANIAARAQQLIGTVAFEADRRSLATIVDQAMRAHEMLAEMMRVVQPKPLNLRVEDVVAVVRQSMESQSEQWMHSKILVQWKLSDHPLYALIDRASMSEAIQSLVQNALQVCRPNDRIQLDCFETYDDEKESVGITLRDTGPGMSNQARQRAWDLYYSGREHGRGLGISLANVRRIIDAHHGRVWIDSSPDAGCTVQIRLPKAKQPAASRKLPTF